MEYRQQCETNEVAESASNNLQNEGQCTLTKGRRQSNHNRNEARCKAVADEPLSGRVRVDENGKDRGGSCGLQRV